MTNPRTLSPLRLYSFHLSGHSHRAALMCSLLGLRVQIEEVDMAAGGHKHESFLQLNPLGQVPVLVDGEQVVADSNAIIVYLALAYDASRTWYPREPLAVARVQRWLSLAAGELAAGPATARAARLFHRPVDERPAAIATRLFRFMDRELSHSAFLTGELPTVADVAMYTYTAHAPEGGVELHPYAAIRDWLKRVEALQGFVGLGR